MRTEITTFLCFCIVLLCISTKLTSQINKTTIDFIPKSPEQSTIEQYGNLSVNHATGVPNIDIPLYTIELDNLEIPVSISYLATGIRVNDISTSVGLKWMLNAGGEVSRNIVGMPDEVTGGWFEFDKGDIDENVCDLDVLEFYYNGAKEATPDIFSYRFGQYDGGFFFDYDENLIKVKGQDINIDYDIPGSDGRPYKFDFTDKFGNKYMFNEDPGDFSSTETTYIATSATGSPETSRDGSGITAWKVDRIETPSGKNIDFEYKEHTIRTGRYLTSNEYNISDSQGDIPEQIEGLISYYSSYTYNLSLIKTIMTDIEKIDFFYEEDDEASIMQKRLEKIIVTDRLTDNIIKTIFFLYDTYEGDSRLKLTGVKICGEDSVSDDCMKYFFSYKDGKLPPLGSIKQDVFGYINNNTDTRNHMIPCSHKDLPISCADREVDPDVISKGILKSIQYPTGGKTIFKYEPNYSVEGSVKSYYPGLRVKNITDYNTDGEKYNEKDFFYSDPIPGCANSVHFKGNYQRYYEDFTSSKEPIYEYERWSSHPLQNPMHTPVKSNFFYGKVEIEHKAKETGKTINKYQGHSENFVIKPSLREQKIYDDEDYKVKHVNYEYEKDASLKVTGFTTTNSYLYCGYYYCPEIEQYWAGCITQDHTGPFMYYGELHPVYYYDLRYHRPIDKKVTDYFDQGQDSTVTTINYQYNERGLLSKQTQSFSNDENLIKNEYTYVCDLDFGSGEHIYKEMEARHMIFYLVEQKLIKNKPNNHNDILKNGRITTYKKFDNSSIIKPSHEYIFEAIQQVEDPVKISVDNHGNLNIPDYYNKLKTYDKYDEHGNLLQYQREDGIPVSYIWGYNHQYPIAEIKNATYEEATSYLDIDELQDENRNKLIEEFNLHRDIMPEAIITSYTYKPLVGVTTKTDARQRTTKYDYDNMGRLKKVLDNEGNIIEHNKYNYIGPVNIDMGDDYTLSFNINYLDKLGNEYNPEDAQHKIRVWEEGNSGANSFENISDWMPIDRDFVYQQEDLISGELNINIKVKDGNDDIISSKMITPSNKNIKVNTEGVSQVVTVKIELVELIHPHIPKKPENFEFDYSEIVSLEEPGFVLSWEEVFSADNYNIKKNPIWLPTTHEKGSWNMEWAIAGYAENEIFYDYFVPENYMIKDESNPYDPSYIYLRYRVRSQNTYGHSPWTNACGQFKNQNLTLYELKLDSADNSPPIGILGKEYEHNFKAIQAIEPYSYEIIKGELPPGLEFDTATGKISGKPTQKGYFDFAIKVTDNCPATCETDFALKIRGKQLTIQYNEEYGDVYIIDGDSVFVNNDHPHEFEYNSVLSVSAEPKEYHKFNGWKWENIVISEDKEKEVKMDEDITLTASFEKITKTLKLDAGNNGSVSVEGEIYTGEGNEIKKDINTEVNIVATPDNNYEFSNWAGNFPPGERKNPAIAIELDDNKEITASFKKIKRNLNLKIENGGSINVNDSISLEFDHLLEFDHGKDVSLSAKSDGNCAFDKWSGDRNTTNESIELSMTKDKEVTAEFILLRDLTIYYDDYKGSVEVNGNNFADGSYKSYTDGEMVTLEAIPSSNNYEFISWTGDHNSSNNTTNITMDKDRDVEANFAKKEKSLTVHAGTGGGVTVYKDGYTELGTVGENGTKSWICDINTEITLQANPNTDADYIFSEWYGDKFGTEDKLTFNLSDDASVHADFSKQRTLNITFKDGGMVRVNGQVYSISPYTGKFTEGSTVEIEAIPDDQWWGWCNEETGKEIEVEMNADIALEAYWEDPNPTYDLTLIVQNGGEVEVNNKTKGPGQHTIKDIGENLDITLTASTYNDYNWVGWSGDNTESSQQITLTMTKDKEVTAEFILLRDLTIYYDDYKGSVEVNGNNFADGSYESYTDGEMVTLEAIPSSNNYEFISWTGDHNSSNNTTNITMDKDRDVEANFAKKEKSLTVHAGTGGSVTVYKDGYIELGTVGENGTKSWNCDINTEITLQANPNTGDDYIFSEWYGDETGIEDELTFNLSDDASVHADFSKQHTLTISFKEDGGMVRVNGQVYSISPYTGKFTEGSTVELEAIPDDEWWGWSNEETGKEIEVEMNAGKYLEALWEYPLIPID